MKNTFIVAIATSILFLGGCQSMDDSFLNKIDASQVEKESGDSISSKVIKGKTTKDEIITMFGKPQTKSTYDDGREAWTYSDMNFNTKLITYLPIPVVSSIFGGTTYQSKSLIIFFNHLGVVESYTFNSDGY
ncbi:MAG: hypothetical protein Q4C68_06635 [Moraxella sp.]|nr:hypothetical protein [Moraxella sp.]